MNLNNENHIHESSTETNASSHAPTTAVVVDVSTRNTAESDVQLFDISLRSDTDGSTGSCTNDIYNNNNNESHSDHLVASSSCMSSSIAKQEQQQKREALWQYYNNGVSFDVGCGDAVAPSSQQKNDIGKYPSLVSVDDSDDHHIITTVNRHVDGYGGGNDGDDDENIMVKPPLPQPQPPLNEADDTDGNDDDEDIVEQLLRRQHGTPKSIPMFRERQKHMPPSPTIRTNNNNNNNNSIIQNNHHYLDDTNTSASIVVGDDLPVTNMTGRYATTPLHIDVDDDDVTNNTTPPAAQIETFDSQQISGQNINVDESEHEHHPPHPSPPPPLNTAFRIDDTTPISQHGRFWINHHHGTDSPNIDYPPAVVRNCYGVVHVRVVRSQRLSCPIHSTISVIYKLYPWKGKVRSTDKTPIKTFVVPPSTVTIPNESSNSSTSTDDQKNDGSTDSDTAITIRMDHGVCAQWVDDTSHQSTLKVNINDDTTSRYSGNTATNTTNHFIKMIHAYSDPISSPIPMIQIDLLFCPIVSFIEFTMCSFSIDCTTLFQYPNRIHTQWFTATPSGHTTTTTSSNDTDLHDILTRNVPLIEIEAMFEPAITEVSPEADTLSSTSTPAVVTATTTTTTVSPQINVNLEYEDFSERSMNQIVAGDDDETESSILLPPTLMNDGMASNALPGAITSTNILLDLEQDITSRKMDERVMEDDMMSMSTVRTSKTTVVPLQQHLLQISNFRFTPAFCCACGKSLFSLQVPSLLSWNRNANHNRTGISPNSSLSSSSWRCERCLVDCCDDCRLQVDILLPCGSDRATAAVVNAIQNKFTMDKILNAVAPTTDHGTKKNEFLSSKSNSLHLDDDDISERTIPGNIDIPMENKLPILQGIGVLTISLQRALLLKDALSAETDPVSIIQQVHPHLRPGDYYIRIQWSGGGNQIVTVGDRDQKLTSVRTRTIQRSSGQLNFSFDNEMMRFVVPHYGMEYRIDIVDATTDKTIGTGLITAHGILQQQRDYLVEEKRLPFLSFIRKPILFTEMRRIVVELRAALKNGFSDDFYTPAKSRSSLSDGEVRSGDIVGCVELTVCLEENFEGLFGQYPYACPPRPGEDLNMAVFQAHLQRLSNILDDLKQIIEAYKFVVSWKNPYVTGISLIIFLRLCIWFDPAYTGSVPVFISILLLSYLASIRASGSMKAKYVQKEIEKYCKAENGVIKYDVHRPVGLVRLNIVKGRNIRSPELGLAANVGCRVLLDLTRLVEAKQRKKELELDQSVSAPHEFGSTAFVFGIEPAWERMIKSDRAMRMNLLLPHQGSFFDADDGTNDVSFPVLQPISTTLDLQVLDPWESSNAAIVVEVRLSDLLNVIPGSEYSLGEVVIPFRDLVIQGEMSGWFGIVGPALSTLGTDILTTADALKSDDPQLFLTIKWNPPPLVSNSNSLDTEREASYAIQEEMIRSAVLARNQKEKVNILVSSIGALNSVRGISANLQTVQNQLGWSLDFVESCMHLFDFTDPFKSSLILVVLCALWLILSIVSTRLIVLTLGIVQYATTLKARIDRWFRSGRSSKHGKAFVEVSTNNKVSSEIPVMAWIVNAIRGLPTSEDLRKTYFWESRRMGTQETESLSVAKRKARMQRLWRVQWYGTIRMLMANKKNDHAEWRTVFVLFQGHRLLWWRSIHDFDNGIAPLGRLLLAGHAGLSNPSPLEIREMNADEIDRVVCIFGSGSRATLLASSVDSKLDLEKAIEAALFNKQD